MRKYGILPIFLLALISPCMVMAEGASLVSALQETYIACVGADEGLYELKKAAGVSTALGAVGAGVGTGAFAVGVAKKEVDDSIDAIEIKLEVLRKIDESDPIREEQDFSGIEERLASEPDYEEILRIIQEFTVDQSNKGNLEQDLKDLTDKSKKLGNWRTGLMGAGTAINVAGALVSGIANKKIKIEELVANCQSSVNDLNKSIAQASLNGEDVTEARLIADACADYDFIDAHKITKFAQLATLSSAVGATTAATGTVLSAVSNSDNIRNDDTATGKQKQDNLNTASNVFAVGSAVSGVASTALSAAQIVELKKIISISEKCSSILKYGNEAQ